MTIFTGTIPTITPGETTSAIPSLATYRDVLKAASEAWTTYTPSWKASTSNPTLNNGTLVGHYRQINKTVDFWIKLTIGSTTAVGSGVYQLSIPVTAFTGHPLHFDVFYNDASSTLSYRGVTSLNSGNDLYLFYDASIAGGQLSTLTDATPAVPAVGDTYTVAGTYETA